MMFWKTGATLLAGAGLVSAQGVGGGAGATAQPGGASAPPVPYTGGLQGTWNSKANKTTTGPSFYDAKNEELVEPSHPGISYSFTKDGHYESAYYRAISNPVNPACPKAIMQWQHGTWEKLTNGSLVLTPFTPDGRQLMSDPCNLPNSIYTRYNVTELFERFELYIDPYHNVPRLNLFRFDGSPLMPLYIAYNPPQMLPTSTLHPTSTASSTGSASSSRKQKRHMGELHEDTEELIKRLGKRDVEQLVVRRSRWVDANAWWWFGVGVTGVGGFMYFCF